VPLPAGGSCLQRCYDVALPPAPVVAEGGEEGRKQKRGGGVQARVRGGKKAKYVVRGVEGVAYSGE
jgi:hypothetical protein